MWSEGDVVLHREVLNSGHCWCHMPVRVVQDTPELLVTYVEEGAPIGYPPAPFEHPWQPIRDRWEGHGALSLRRPEDPYSVLAFWEGPQRAFACWYVNFAEPIRRHADAYDTQDLELDLIVWPDGRLELKDDESLDQRVREGRFTQDQADATRDDARRLIAELDAGRRWWDDAWSCWAP